MKYDDQHFYSNFLDELDVLRAAPDGVGTVPALRVYANTGLLACIEALQSNYPSVRKLLGPHEFDRLARAYACKSPASDGRLFLYGGDFVHSLAEGGGEDSAIVHLALLDRYWSEVHAEADAATLTMSWIAQQAEEAFESIYLQPAPATRWLAHSRMPLWDWWQKLHEPLGVEGLQVGEGQAVLLTRSEDVVCVQDLSLAGAALLQACHEGETLQQALMTAASNETNIDLHGLLVTLFAADAFQHPDQYKPRAIL